MIIPQIGKRIKWIGRDNFTNSVFDWLLYCRNAQKYIMFTVHYMNPYRVKMDMAKMISAIGIIRKLFPELDFGSFCIKLRLKYSEWLELIVKFISWSLKARLDKRLVLSVSHTIYLDSLQSRDVYMNFNKNWRIINTQ